MCWQVLPTFESSESAHSRSASLLDFAGTTSDLTLPCESLGLGRNHTLSAGLLFLRKVYREVSVHTIGNSPFSLAKQNVSVFAASIDDYRGVPLSLPLGWLSVLLPFLCRGASIAISLASFLQMVSRSPIARIGNDGGAWG